MLPVQRRQYMNSGGASQNPPLPLRCSKFLFCVQGQRVHFLKHSSVLWLERLYCLYWAPDHSYEPYLWHNKEASENAPLSIILYSSQMVQQIYVLFLHILHIIRACLSFGCVIPPFIPLFPSSTNLDNGPLFQHRATALVYNLKLYLHRGHVLVIAQYWFSFGFVLI